MIKARNEKGYVNNTNEGLTTKKVVIGSSIIAAGIIGGSVIISKGTMANVITRIYTTFVDKLSLEDIKKLDQSAM